MTAPASRCPSPTSGVVPDPFREGARSSSPASSPGGTFVAEKDSLITKCPSKFTDEAAAGPEHVVIDQRDELGTAALVAALLAAIYAAGAALRGARGGDRRWVDSSRRALYCVCGLLTVAVVSIEMPSCPYRLSVPLVAEHSSTTTPHLLQAHRAVGEPGGLADALGVRALDRHRGRPLPDPQPHREIVPWATAILMGLGAFFVGLMLFKSSPFVRVDPAPAEGAGL